MRILIVRPTPNKMNLKTYNLQEVGLAKALIRKGHECDVAYYGGKEKDHWEYIAFDKDKEVGILWLHGYGVFREGIYPSLGKYVKDYDVVQVGGHESVSSCWLNRYAQNKTVNYQGPYFCEENKGDIKKARILDRVLLPLSRKKNMIVATKSVLASDYIKGKGIQDVTTVGVGLDLDNILNSSVNCEEHEFVKDLKEQKGNHKYLLYIGALEKRRNILFLLEVFKKASERMDNIKLIVIGKGESEYVNSCFEKIKELNIEDKVIYCERLEQKYLKAVYEASDAFLLPTRYEIFGMVLLEAMYFGLPVFTTWNGGSSTLMTEDNGIVIKEMDTDVWAGQICDVMEDRDRVSTISVNAKKTIAEQYTWDALADKFIELYKKRLDS